MSSLLFSSSLLPVVISSSDLSFFRRRSDVRRPTTPSSHVLSSISASASSSSRNSGYEDSSSKSVKLVTFLGKGGSGKTTSAILAAQHYAMSGLRTCLVVQTQDPSAEYLLNCKIGTSPSKCNDNLSAVRLETTKMLLEPLDRLKQADARLKLTQGALDGVVGEELGVLPAMDSIFALLVLARLMGLLTSATPTNNGDNFDIIIYDGMSADESLRMIGAASKARLYLKYLRNLSEKTDLGRLAGPSVLRLLEESVNLSGGNLNGKTSADIWNGLEKMLERGSSAFYGLDNFRCFLVMDPRSPASVNSALRYWGCTIQAGAQIYGAIGISSPHLSEELVKEIKNNFLPLPFAFAPHLSTNYPLDWNSIVRNASSQEVRTLFSLPSSRSSCMTPPVKYDVDKKSVTLLMPGFDKSEIKLYQYRGGSELLVEAGDQRRVIFLPPKVQGKVSGAKFMDRSLVISMR